MSAAPEMETDAAGPEAEAAAEHPFASPPTIDLEALLAPIAGDDPAGKNLAYAAEYDQIREARKADDDLPQGAWQRETKSAEWHRVVQVAAASLREKTKDLQIAAWLTEALAHLHGFAGLRDGLRLMLGIQRRYWEGYYPRIDDGDLESREGPFLLLNDPRTLPRIVRGVALTDADERFDYFRYKESRDVDNAIRKDPSQESALVSQGKITGAKFDEQVAQTPRRSYERLVADLRGARDAFDGFEADTDDRFGRDAPSLMNLRDALADCLRLLEPILEQKRQSEPDPALDAVLAGPQAAPAPTDGDGTPAASEANADGAGPQARPGGGTTVELGPAPQAAEFGKILIDFLPRARALNELGEKLEANRRQYDELLSQIRALDLEYEQLSRQFSQSQEAYQLLGRLLKIPSASNG